MSAEICEQFIPEDQCMRITKDFERPDQKPAVLLGRSIICHRAGTRNAPLIRIGIKHMSIARHERSCLRNRIT